MYCYFCVHNTVLTDNSVIYYNYCSVKLIISEVKINVTMVWTHYQKIHIRNYNINVNDHYHVLISHCAVDHYQSHT